ncbi:MAG TPA: methyltransferase domain-containing protein [Mesorhizobium sp.]|nr:methyltransferase domain-containing protein [Mesorhizobium sp.]
MCSQRDRIVQAKPAIETAFDVPHVVILPSAKAITDRRGDFREGSVVAIPFEAATFGKVCTVNTVYFWSSLDAGFAEIRRVLAPCGRVVIGFLPK